MSDVLSRVELFDWIKEQSPSIPSKVLNQLIDDIDALEKKTFEEMQIKIREMIQAVHDGYCDCRKH